MGCRSTGLGSYTSCSPARPGAGRRTSRDHAGGAERLHPPCGHGLGNCEAQARQRPQAPRSRGDPHHTSHPQGTRTNGKARDCCPANCTGRPTAAESSDHHLEEFGPGGCNTRPSTLWFDSTGSHIYAGPSAGHERLPWSLQPRTTDTRHSSSHRGCATRAACQNARQRRTPTGACPKKNPHKGG